MKISEGIRGKENLIYYSSLEYNNKGRFCSYWHQIDEIVYSKPGSILEIGTGNKFTSGYLKRAGFNVLTLDINCCLRPDVSGSVLSLPFLKDSFDMVVCYEVMEHIPHECFREALSELYRVAKSKAVISLPDIERCYKIYFKTPKNIELKKYIVVRKRKNFSSRSCGEHCWEIGEKGLPLEKILQDIRSSGFCIERTYRVFENTYHRFFILNKSTLNGHYTSRKAKIRIGNLEVWRGKCYEEELSIRAIIKNTFLRLFPAKQGGGEDIRGKKYGDFNPPGR